MSESYLAAFGIWAGLQVCTLVGFGWFLSKWVAHSKALEQKLDDMFDEMNEGQ